MKEQREGREGLLNIFALDLGFTHGTHSLIKSVGFLPSFHYVLVVELYVSSTVFL